MAQRVAGGGWQSGAAVLAVMFGGLILLGQRAEQPAALPVLDAAQRADCETALKLAAQAGIVRGRPAPLRIDVEDRMWATLPAETKKQTLAAVSCAVLGRWAPAGLAEGPVVAYGYRSGRRAAMLSEAGFSFE